MKIGQPSQTSCPASKTHIVDLKLTTFQNARLDRPPSANASRNPSSTESQHVQILEISRNFLTNRSPSSLGPCRWMEKQCNLKIGTQTPTQWFGASRKRSHGRMVSRIRKCLHTPQRGLNSVADSASPWTYLDKTNPCRCAIHGTVEVSITQSRTPAKLFETGQVYLGLCHIGL